MDYSKKNFLDYVAVKDQDIVQTAHDFYDFLLWTRKHQYTLGERIPLDGSTPRGLIFNKATGETKNMINFGSNDYLNLTSHPKTKQAAMEALQKYGTGAGSAPVLGGNFDLHQNLINKVAEIKHTEDAIIFTSGYATNIGSLKALLKEGDLAIVDQYAHASIQDGCTSAMVRIFKHSDMNSLENVLRLNSTGNFRTKIICIDGVYSMDGDIAPLPEIMQIAKKYNAFVYVDDAHAVGVIGATGKGTCEHFHLEGKIDFIAGTFSKAIGSQGGYVAASKEVIEYLRYYSRAHMFSTAMTPAAAAASLAAIEIITSNQDRKNKLWKNINYLRGKLLSNGFNIGSSETAIIPIIIGNDEKVMKMNNYLHEQNIYTHAVVFPAVPIELSRIRLSLTQDHTEEELDLLVEHLVKKGKELNII